MKGKYIHMLFELFAILILAPFFIYLAYKQTNNFDRYALIAVAAGTVIVDGGLFLRWLYQ